MSPASKKEVSEFLVRNAPKDLVEGLNVLSALKFPIPDKRSFEEGLNEAKKDDKTVKRLIQSFTVQDFPILSTENAFEKFSARFQIPNFPILRPPLIPGYNLPDFRERPSPCEVFSQSFTGMPADCACRAYQQALRGGLNEYQAIVIGVFAGQRAQRTGRCEV